MTVLRLMSLVIALLSLVAGTPRVAAQTEVTQPPPQTQREPEQVEEFVPFEGVPPEDQIPAASLLIPAYALVWIGVFLYVVSVAKRLGTVQKEVERLEIDMKQGKRP